MIHIAEVPAKECLTATPYSNLMVGGKMWKTELKNHQRVKCEKGKCKILWRKDV